MHIIEVHLNDAQTLPLGLQPVDMEKIGKTVLLAGRNGSGKTRLLNLIREQAANLSQFHHAQAQASRQIGQVLSRIKVSERNIGLLSNSDPVNLIPRQAEEVKRLSSQEELKALEKIVATPPPIVTNTGQIDVAVVDFIPNSIELYDWSNFSKQEWVNRANQAYTLGVASLQNATIPLIQLISERWVNTSHQILNFSTEEKVNAEADYHRLQEIVENFLGERLGWDIDGFSTIFGKPIAQAHLSAGQRVLLQLSVAIFAQGGTLANHIVFMDEPENHLHPSSVVDLLDRIGRINASGQIWIATHSIPLLSHFESSSLWFVDDGQIRFSGRRPENVLRSLLGEEDQIARLRDFTSLPDELARSRFAFECLLPPKVVDSGAKDPQTEQLFRQLQKIREVKGRIRLLDFGAGKGRMIANFVDYPELSPDSLDYRAFDHSAREKDECIRNIASVYSDSEDRYFNSLDVLSSKLDDHYFDIVVLCNVLHEIPYVSWIELFQRIKLQLREDGFLLLIEDCRLPVGELPHQNGFHVFNTLHLKKLLDIPSEAPGFVVHDARFDSLEQRGRLMAHLIPELYLARISMATIRAALLALKTTSIDEIRKIRSEAPSYSKGLSHGFWIQQLANTTMSLLEIGPS